MQNSIKQGNAIQAVYTMRPPFTSMHLHFLAALCCFPKIGESASKPWRVLSCELSLNKMAGDFGSKLAFPVGVTNHSLFVGLLFLMVAIEF